MPLRSIDPRQGGYGDAVVSLWIAEGARRVGEEIPFVIGRHTEVIEAFGHATILAPTEECMGLGYGTKTYSDEFEREYVNDEPRTSRWQRSMGWDYLPSRPKLSSVSADARAWARAMRGDSPIIVIAPRANIESRSLPIQKWLRLAWSLQNMGIRTIAMDQEQHVVSNFPFYVYGFGWHHVLALLQEASVVGANDSGIAHLASTIGTRTVVAMGPTNENIVFGHCLENVRFVSTSRVPCRGCHYFASRGNHLACNSGCEALQLLDWIQLRDALVEEFEAASNLSTSQTGAY